MDWKTKLTSRKFWTAIAGFVSMMAMALGADEASATQITALIMAGASVIAYIVGEGMIDSASAGAHVYGDAVDTGMEVPVEIDKPPEVAGE